MRRLSLVLSDVDFAILARVAEVSRLRVGTWARGVVIREGIEVERSLRESGRLAEFDRLSLFQKPQAKKARGRK
jgi:hypothetical protein